MGVQNPNERPIRVRKPAPKKVRVVVPRPEVTVQAKPRAKVGSKAFPAPKPEVTRPVTAKVRADTERRTMLANRAYLVKRANEAENKAEGHYVNALGLTIHPEASLKPGLQALNIVATPLHAIAGAANRATGRGFAGLTPGQLVKGAKEGIHQKTTYSNVLKTAGVKNKAVLAVGGFAGDVLLDPTTYLTFGTTSLAREAAQKAGTRVAEKALAQGMTRDVAERLAKQAAKKAAKGTEGQMVKRAVTVGVGKRKLKIVPLPAKKGVKGLAGDVAEAVNPRFVHPLADAEAQKAVKSAHLEARAQASTGVGRTVRRAQHLAKLKPAEQTQVIDAIEKRQIAKLPEHLKEPAIRVRSDFRHMARTEKAQGILGRTIEDYFPHVRRQDAEIADKVTVGRGSNPAALGSSKVRKIKEPLAAIRETNPELFTENLAHAYAVRGRASAEGVARSKLYKEVAATGRKLTPGAEIDTAKELVYKVTPTGLKPLVKEGGDKIDLQAIEKAANGSAGQHVILNKKVVENLQEKLGGGSGSIEKIARGYVDRPMGALKSSLTVLNPPYHFRNLVGDSWNSYLYQSFPHLVRNFKHAVQGQRAFQHLHKAEGELALRAKVKGVGGHIDVGGEQVPYDQFIKRARDAGVVDSGFYGRDIVELVKGPQGPGHHPLDTIRRIGQARENLVRLNTFASALKKGLPDRAAARVAMEHHFDYGDLSPLEKRFLRRLFPFYTFTARNAPLQARKLVTKPGKYANLEKLREELAKSTGLPVAENTDYQHNLKDYEQLGMPFPIPGVTAGGKKQLGYLSLPTTDLNRLTANPMEQARLIGQSATPLKLPLEEALNYSLFFRSAIDQGRPVSAPDWVGSLPGSVKKELGVVKALDKQSGKHVWKWKAKVDYAVKQIPQMSAVLQAMSSGSNRRGQGTVAKVVSQTGVRVQPYDPVQAQIDKAYKGLTYLENKRAISDAGSAERKRLNAKIGAQQNKIAKLKGRAGYAITGEKKSKGDYGDVFVKPSSSSVPAEYKDVFK